MKKNNLSKNLDNIKQDIVISKAINNSIKNNNYNIQNGDKKFFILKLNKKTNTIDNCFIEKEISLYNIRKYNNSIVRYIEDINKLRDEVNNDKRKISKEDIDKIEKNIGSFERNSVLNKIKTITSPNQTIETYLIECSICNNAYNISDELKDKETQIWSLEKAEEFIKNNIEYVKSILTEIKEKFSKQQEDIKIDKVTTELINNTCKKYIKEQNIKIEKDGEKTFIVQFDKNENYKCHQIYEITSLSINMLLDYNQKLANYKEDVKKQYEDILNTKKDFANENIDKMEQTLNAFKNDECFLQLKNNISENNNIETYIGQCYEKHYNNYIYSSSKKVIELRGDKSCYERIHSEIQDIIDKIKQIKQKKEQDEEKKRKIEEELKLKEQKENEIKQQKKGNIKKVKKAKSYKQYRLRRRLQELYEMGTKQNRLKNGFGETQNLKDAGKADRKSKTF